MSGFGRLPIEPVSPGERVNNDFVFSNLQFIKFKQL
jgi:hypothetical protein